MTGKVVAIDGPAGAGKTSIARAVASHFHFALLDTGALYRAVALGAWRAGIAGGRAPPLRPMCMISCNEVCVTCCQRATHCRCGSMATTSATAIRTPEISKGASCVERGAFGAPSLAAVATTLVEDGVSVVAEGRDIGTVVFADADVKLFVTASPDRARNGGIASCSKKA